MQDELIIAYIMSPTAQLSLYSRSAKVSMPIRVTWVEDQLILHSGLLVHAQPQLMRRWSLFEAEPKFFIQIMLAC